MSVKHALGPLLATSVLVAACGSPRVEPAGTAVAVPVAIQTERQTALALLLDRCPVSDPDPDRERLAPTALPAVVAAALVPVAVDFAVSAVTDYLARLQSERTASYIATGAGELPAVGRACLVVLRGRIGTRSSSELPQQGSLDNRAMQRVGLTAPPDFYMEARLEVAQRPAAPALRGQPAPAPATDLVLRPQLVHFARTAARRGRDEPKTVGMVLVMRGSPAAAGADATAAANAAEVVVPLNFGAIAPGREIRPATFPVRGDASEQRADHPLADLVQNTALQGGARRLNLYAFTTETAEPDRVLQLVNDALGRQSKGLQDALTTAIQDAIKKALEPAPRS